MPVLRRPSSCSMKPSNTTQDQHSSSISGEGEYYKRVLLLGRGVRKVGGVGGWEGCEEGREGREGGGREGATSL